MGCGALEQQVRQKDPGRSIKQVVGGRFDCGSRDGIQTMRRHVLCTSLPSSHLALIVFSDLYFSLETFAGFIWGLKLKFLDCESLRILRDQRNNRECLVSTYNVLDTKHHNQFFLKIVVCGMRQVQISSLLFFIYGMEQRDCLRTETDFMEGLTLGWPCEVGESNGA